VRLDPSYLEAIDALGLALESLGDDAAAVAKYEQAIALNEKQGGRFASAHVNLSAYYNRTADAERALEYARKAQELDPDSDRAWFQEGKAHERKGDLEKAVFALNRALTLNPRASTYYYVLSGVYRRLGWMDEHRKALEEFKRLEKESGELDKKRRGGTNQIRGGSPSDSPTPSLAGAPKDPAPLRRARRWRAWSGSMGSGSRRE
jgi:tetratricopeptide (TPR) repeat protein